MAIYHRIVRKTKVSSKELRAMIEQDIVEVFREVGEETVERLRETAPVYTGSLRASIYMATGGQSTYAQAASDARLLNSRAIITPGHSTQSRLTLVIGSAVLHSLFVEHGTVAAPAYPFFAPQMEWLRSELNTRLRDRRKNRGLRR